MTPPLFAGRKSAIGRSRGRITSSHTMRCKCQCSPGQACCYPEGTGVWSYPRLWTYESYGCPMRRVDQRYIIATKTSIDISSVKIPDSVNDDLFKRTINNKTTKKSSLFSNEKKDKEKYAPSEERKKLTAEVESQVIAVLEKHPEKEMMFKYIASKFSLQKGDYPHKMIF